MPFLRKSREKAYCFAKSQHFDVPDHIPCSFESIGPVQYVRECLHEDQRRDPS